MRTFCQVGENSIGSLCLLFNHPEVQLVSRPLSFSLYGESWCLGILRNLSTSTVVNNPLSGFLAARCGSADL